MPSKKNVKGPEVIQDNPEIMNPVKPEEFVRRGWIYYDRQDYAMARDDFLKALQSIPDDIDLQYALGLTAKMAGNKTEAISYFEKLLNGISTLEDQVRASMLRRLALGHIHLLKEGDWKIRVNE